MLKNWEKLEHYVAERLKPIYKYSRTTIASGATPVEKGDVKNPYFLIEAKCWNTDSLSIKNDVWRQTKIHAACDHKDAIYVIENKSGTRIAVLDLDDWINMVIELIELRELTKDAAHRK